MDNRTYPSLIIKMHRSYVLFSMLIIAFLQYLIVELMTTMDVDAFYGNVLTQLPERFQMLISESFITRLSVDGAVAFGFNHPLVLTLLFLLSITLPSRHIAGDIENGTMELLLAHPVKRYRLLISLWATGGLLLLAVILAGGIGSAVGLADTGHLSGKLVLKILELGANLWLLAVLVLSLAMLISVFGKEGGRAGIRAAALILIFYFLFFLGILWDAIHTLTPYNIFAYYQPTKLMFGERSFWLHAVVLSVLIIISLAVSLRQFQRRDIPG
jgi:ABC-2 type transport system permease protein